MPKRQPGPEPRYELVASSFAREATIRYVLDGGVIPICNPGQTKAVQQAIDTITQRDGWTDERRERLGEVLTEIVEARELTAEVTFQQSRTKRYESTSASHGRDSNAVSGIKRLQK